jgi:hypothetical protein
LIMPTKPKRRRKHGPRNLIIKIPLTAETLTAAMMLLQEILQLVHTLKLPMQVEKVGER